MTNMQKMNFAEMQAIEGGSDPCFWAQVGYVLGGAGLVLSGGAAAPVLLGLGAGLSAVFGACS